MARTPFHDLDAYLAIPRVGGLAGSPDGRRLVVSVETLDPDRTAYRTALWEVDPAGVAPARRLTRSARSEWSAVFTANGDLLFTSYRPDPDAADKADPTLTLWLLPAGGGEARTIATAPGGIYYPLAARAADRVSVAVDLLPGASSLAEDATLRRERKDRKLSAILHSAYPVRQWSSDLGAEQTRRFSASLSTLTDDPAQPLPPAADPAPADPRLLELTALTGAGRGLFNHGADLSPDGTTLVTTWAVPLAGGGLRYLLVAIDTSTGERRVLVDDPGADASQPAISPDGTRVAYVREGLVTPQRAGRRHLALVDLHGDAAPTRLAADWDRWPEWLAWLPDGSGLVVTADDHGRRPIFLVTIVDGRVEQVTAEDAWFGRIVVAPDGATLYALRDSLGQPTHPVRLDLAAFLAGGAPGQRPPVAASALRGPVAAPDLPGRLTEVEATAADGTPLRAWLALPDSADAAHPAPLVLWIHGGPHASWNEWGWGWNPWPLVAHGYAVLLPDPALSTGYGQEFIQRGWGRWGAQPYTDLMAVTDAAIARAEIDATRLGAMGPSFGGYLANWIAGHTDRFRAIVSAAGIWALDQFEATTDHAYYSTWEMSPEMIRDFSPHRFVASIRTPMLLIHGDWDYRVPIGESLRLWYDLLARSGRPADADGITVHRFLYFPDESHGITSPQNLKLWYDTVLAFLDQHVSGEPPPDSPPPDSPPTGDHVPGVTSPDAPEVG